MRAEPQRMLAESLMVMEVQLNQIERQRSSVHFKRIQQFAMIQFICVKTLPISLQSSLA
jgi:hypothetical protein